MTTPASTTNTTTAASKFTMNPREAINWTIQMINGGFWPLANVGWGLLIEKGYINAIVYFLAGLCCWRTTSREQGARFFEKALALEPEFPRASFAHHALGKELVDQWIANGSRPEERNILKEAAKHFREALLLDKTGENGPGFESLADCLALLGRMAEAVKCYDKALSKSCNRESCLYNKAVCLDALMRYAEALQTLNMLLALNSQHDKAVLLLARIQIALLQSEEDLLSEMQSDQSSDPQPELTLHARSVLEGVAAQIAQALPRLKEKAESLSGRHTPGKANPRVYRVGDGYRPVSLTDQEALACMAVSRGHGLAAVCFAYLGDITQTGHHAEQSRRYNPDSKLASAALAICGHPGPQGLATFPTVTEITPTVAGIPAADFTLAAALN